MSLLLAFTTGVTLGLEAWAGAGSGTLALALGALGVAAATKISMVPLAAVLAVVFTIGAVRTVRWAGIGTGALAFAVALVPWMVRTIARTGLPFSPLPLKVGPLILGQATPELLWYMRRQALRPYREDIIRTASFEAWKRRLHDHHVTDVMSFTPRSMELEWMEAHPDLFEKRCGDREWGLFRLK